MGAAGLVLLQPLHVIMQTRQFRNLRSRAQACQTLVMAVERPRRVEVRSFPSNRRIVTAAMRAGRRRVPMYGLAEVDVTTANRLLAGHDPPWSLTAFVVASAARAAAAHPPVHAYRNEPEIFSVTRGSSGCDSGGASAFGNDHFQVWAAAGAGRG